MTWISLRKSGCSPIWIWAVIAFFSGFWILQADAVRAQDSDSSKVTNQLWADYYRYWRLKPSVQFYGDMGFRYLIDDGSWWVANIRPSVRLMQGNWIEPRGGLGVFFTYNEQDSNQLELRPWQGALIRWPTVNDRLHLHHYFRAEERLQWQTQMDWEFSAQLRLRYRIGSGLPLPILHPAHHFSVPLSAEWFLNMGDDLNERFFSRARYTVGIRDTINDRWSVELLFTLQESRSSAEESFDLSDRLFQVRIRHFIQSRDMRTKMALDDQ